MVVPRATQPSISPGSVNEDHLRLRRQRQVWFIPFVDKRVNVQVKLCDPLTTRAILEGFCGEVPSRRGVMSSLLYLLHYIVNSKPNFPRKPAKYSLQFDANIDVMTRHRLTARLLSTYLLTYLVSYNEPNFHTTNKEKPYRSSLNSCVFVRY